VVFSAKSSHYFKDVFSYRKYSKSSLFEKELLSQRKYSKSSIIQYFQGLLSPLLNVSFVWWSVIRCYCSKEYRLVPIKRFVLLQRKYSKISLFLKRILLSQRKYAPLGVERSAARKTPLF
jgi:hypothetical protein